MDHIRDCYLNLEKKKHLLYSNFHYTWFRRTNLAQKQLRHKTYDFIYNISAVELIKYKY